MFREDNKGRKRDGLVYYTPVLKSNVLRERELLGAPGNDERKEAAHSPGKDLLQNPTHQTEGAFCKQLAESPKPMAMGDSVVQEGPQQEGGHFLENTSDKL